MEHTFTVNGQEVKGYKLGDPNGTTGTITITGFFKDLLAALPVNFYVAGWDNTPAQMTVNTIKIWFPQYISSNVGTPTTQQGQKENIDKRNGKEVYYERTDIVTTNIKHEFALQKRSNTTATTIFGGSDYFEIGTDILLIFAKKLNEFIPFNGILPIGYQDKLNTIMMDEEVTQKSINKYNMEKFLKMLGASFNGLEQIVAIKEDELPTEAIIKKVETQFVVKDARMFYDGLDWSNPVSALRELISGLSKINEDVVKSSATITAEGWPGDLAGYPEMVSTIDAMSSLLSTKSLSKAGITINIRDFISTDPYSLIYLLRNAKISVELGTTEKGPCVVFWGLDAMGPDKSPTNE